jgi:HrpA-like RNA helicase
MSATGDFQTFRNFYAEFHPNIIELPGQQKMITDIYLKTETEIDWCNAAAQFVRRIVADPDPDRVNPSGDVLIFCQGQAEMDDLMWRLEAIQLANPALAP